METKMFIICSEDGEMVKSIKNSQASFSKDIFKAWNYKTDAQNALNLLLKTKSITDSFAVKPIIPTLEETFIYKNIDRSEIENMCRYVIYNPFTDCYLAKDGDSTKNPANAASYQSIQQLKKAIQARFYPKKSLLYLILDKEGAKLDDLRIPENAFDDFHIVKIRWS